MSKNTAAESQAEYFAGVQSGLSEVFDSFHLSATATTGAIAGTTLEIPCPYQIAEPGFRPYRFGKATPEALQAVLDDEVTKAAERNIDIGLKNTESLKKLAVQLGLGIDCSNFAYRALTAIHDELGLVSYASTVMRNAAEIKDLAASKASWQPKDGNEETRSLTEAERALLNERYISIGSIATIFGKDPEFITGAAHIAASASTAAVAIKTVLPGDVLAFKTANSNKVSHVGIVDFVEHLPSGSGSQINFMHAWHTRDFDGGVREDEVLISRDGNHSWSHSDLGNPDRYSGYSFLRPIAMHTLQQKILTQDRMAQAA